MAKQRYETMFTNKPNRQGKITLTLTKRYVSFSAASADKLGNPPYIKFAKDTEAKDTICVFPLQKQEPGSFKFFSKETNRWQKIMQPKTAEALAKELGHTLKNSNYRFIGEYDEKDRCLRFNSKDCKAFGDNEAKTTKKK